MLDPTEKRLVALSPPPTTADAMARLPLAIGPRYATARTTWGNLPATPDHQYISSTVWFAFLKASGCAGDAVDISGSDEAAKPFL